MTRAHFLNPSALIWLWLVVAAVALHLHAAARRARAIQAFGAGAPFISRKREAFGACAAIALCALALARPAWRLGEARHTGMGRDVIFLLDVSRSMRAEDRRPNRLENAKTAILDGLEQLEGGRVGLVLFAGSAEIRCPLTVDHDYFRMALRQAAPDSVAAGGTMVAPALERVINKLIDPSRAGLTDLILISDGEDQIDGLDEVDAAKKLEATGARLIAIGLGDGARGGRVVVENEETGERSYLKKDEREVWTRLDSATLRRMVEATAEGVYFDVGTGPFDLARMHREIMDHAPRASAEATGQERYEDEFPWFLGAAVGVLLSTHRWRRRP